MPLATQPEALLPRAPCAAGATTSPSILPDVGILQRELVTALALIRTHGNRGWPAATADILSERHRFQVGRVDTRSYPAQVVNGQSRRDWRAQLLIHEPMRPERLASAVRSTIPPLVTEAVPNPTRRFMAPIFDAIRNDGISRRLAWLRHFGCLRGIHRRAMLHRAREAAGVSVLRDWRATVSARLFAPFRPWTVTANVPAGETLHQTQARDCALGDWGGLAAAAHALTGGVWDRKALPRNTPSVCSGTRSAPIATARDSNTAINTRASLGLHFLSLLSRLGGAVPGARKRCPAFPILPEIIVSPARLGRV